MNWDFYVVSVLISGSGGLGNIEGKDRLDGPFPCCDMEGISQDGQLGRGRITPYFGVLYNK